MDGSPSNFFSNATKIFLKEALLITPARLIYVGVSHVHTVSLAVHCHPCITPAPRPSQKKINNNNILYQNVCPQPRLKYQVKKTKP